MARNRFYILIVAAFLVLSSGCGQSVTEVSFEPISPDDDDTNPPDPFVPDAFITTMDLQGGSVTIPYSANRSMSVHSFGGTSLRTYSSSPSFQMSSGIGID